MIGPILAIDPGPKRSGWVIWDPTMPCIRSMGHDENDRVLELIIAGPTGVTQLVLESLTCYGKVVGQDTLDTAKWSGRFLQAWLLGRYLYPVAEQPYRVGSLHLCGCQHAKEEELRHAILSRFPPGTAEFPGLTFQLDSIKTKDGKKHVFAAFAVALTWTDKQAEQARKGVAVCAPAVAP